MNILEKDKYIKVKFKRLDGAIVEDYIRAFSNHEALLEPYSRNSVRPIAILVSHSWCYLDDILEFLE